MSEIKNLKINPEWLYHRIMPENFDKIIESGAILSKRKQMEQKNSPIKIIERKVSYNGVDYISLSKNIPELTFYESSFKFYTWNLFSLVLENITPIKTIYTNKDINPKILINSPKRYSRWKDEFQVKDEISLSHAIAIKLPKKDAPYTDELENQKNLDLLLDIMKNHDFFLPFIDLEEKKRN